jgi:hypothetical protein
MEYKHETALFFFNPIINWVLNLPHCMIGPYISCFLLLKKLVQFLLPISSSVKSSLLTPKAGSKEALVG